MIDANCKCHLIIEAQEVSTQHGTAVKCKFQVLAATDPSQKGKEHSEYFPAEGKAVDKLYNLAEAVGIITPEQRKAAAQAGQGLAIDENLLEGRQLCAEIVMEPNMRKNAVTGQLEVDPDKPGPFPRIGFRTFGVNSPKAADVPKDAQFLGMLGQQPGQSAPPQQATGQESPQPPAPDAGSGKSDGMTW
jgi:hypothetical protein